MSSMFRVVSVIAPFFPTEAQQRGISTTLIGLIISSYTFVMLIGIFVTGIFSKHLGLKFMIGAGMFLTGGAIILFAFLDDILDTATYVALAFAIRITQGLGACMYMSATFSITAALYPRQIGLVYGLLETANTIGRIIGPTVGGSLYSLGGFKLPFIVVGAMLLVFGAISMLLLIVAGYYLPVLDNLEKSTKATPVRNNGGGVDKEDKKRSRKKTTKEKSFAKYFKTSVHGWICSISIVTVSFAMSFPETTLSIYLAQLGMTDPSQVGLVFLLGSLAYAVVCIALGKLSDNFPKAILLVISYVSILKLLVFQFHS